jgi:ubiquinone/menaquinone biosynthesis C-methylase UbiE
MVLRLGFSRSPADRSFIITSREATKSVIKGTSDRGLSMRSTDTVFAGSIPDMYDRYMVPMLFAPYAELVAGRAKAFAPRSILETATGTGAVTEALHRTVPDARIVATDLNEPMLEQARRKIPASNVHFQAANAQDLPFEDGSFDLVVCQFGIMFFPDKVRANFEARRVLRDGGHYLLVIWDSIDANMSAKVAGQAVADLFPDDAGAFYERIPFRYHDPEIIRSDLVEAGFEQVEIEKVALLSRAASARDAALGLVQGTPMRSEVEQRGAGMLDKATDAAAAALMRFETPEGFEAEMSALLVTATR